MFLDVDRDDAGELAALASAMESLVQTGHGWVNLMPEGVEHAELSSTQSVPGMIFGRVSGRGSPVPKITWTAPRRRRRRIETAHLGIEHPAGPKARDLLADAGHPIPAHWPVLQDHPIRGLVVIPTSAAEHTPRTGAGGDRSPALPDHGETIVWAIDAATILAGGGLGTTWQAQVFGSDRNG
ncbi:MAG: hypothetical protein ACLFRV_04740 [Acidimicrobiales bacterium]